MAEFNLAAYAEFDLVAPFIIGHNLLTLLSPLWTSNLSLCYILFLMYVILGFSNKYILHQIFLYVDNELRLPLRSGMVHLSDF